MALWLIGTHHGTTIQHEVQEQEGGAGRGSDNELVLPSQTASRNHARFHREGDVLFLEDLGSLNGTRVNGEAVTGHATARLGDTVEFGSVLLTVAASDAEPSTAMPPLSEDSNLSQSIHLTREEITDSHRAAASDPEVLKLLTDAGQLLVLPEAPEAAFDRILELVERAIPAERILILINEGEGRDPVQRAARVRGDRAISRLMLSRTMVSLVLEKGGAFLTTDAMSDERFMNQQSIMAQDLHSAMAVPLVHHDDTLGLLYVDTSNPLTSYQERDLRVLTLLGQMIGAKVANAKLLEIAREQERMQEELRTADRIQQRLLPQELPEVAGYEIVAFQRTCEAVGGDLYDAAIENEQLHFCLGDVSGKGIGAALLMSDVLASVRTLRPFGVPVDDLVTRLDRHVLQWTKAEHYLTLFLAELDPRAHRLSYVNAGHPPAYLLSGDGTYQELGSTGMPVGLVDLPDMTFEAAVCDFPPGATLIVYSDGVSEAERGPDQFGDSRFQQLLPEFRGLGAAECVQKIDDAVKRYVGDAPATDDVTLVIVRRLDSGTGR
ncbi:MAG: hypothetical protein DHS20C21_02630 [Gemmatimonadota bacterium]|nr:MAG: hypothetical protein DHS20C21_02630 [Gemmatimonadota bacterium]